MKLKGICKKLICGFLAVVVMCACVACNFGGNEPGREDGQNVPMKYLVQDGRCDYSVVIAENASETEEFAAEELVSFMNEVTGVKLPVKRDSEVVYGTSTKIISIGKNDLSKKAGLTNINAREVNTDGFVFKNVGEMIFINSYCDRGTLNGVYDFIERYLGVKFLTFDTTYIPKTKDVQIEQTLNVLEKPAFEIRHVYSQAVSDQLFAARRRLIGGGGETMSKYGGGI